MKTGLEASAKTKSIEQGQPANFVHVDLGPNQDLGRYNAS